MKGSLIMSCVLLVSVAVASGCCPRVPQTNCSVCRSMFEEDRLKCQARHRPRLRAKLQAEQLAVQLVGQAKARCEPDNFRQPTCYNGQVETVDPETGECNGPPHPAWDYWECVPVPDTPQSLVENDGGQWCGEGALPQHAHIWGVRMESGVVSARCLVFRNTPTAREWEEAYRFSVARYRYLEAEAARRDSSPDNLSIKIRVGDATRRETDPFGPTPPVPRSLVGGGTWCGEDVPERFNGLYGPMNCLRRPDGTNNCRAGCVTLDRTPTEQEWERGYQEAILSALRFHREEFERLQREHRQGMEGRERPAIRVLPDTI